MKLNHDWKYRKIHRFNILVNIRNNDILNISECLGKLFESINRKNPQDYNIDKVIEEWLSYNKISGEDFLSIYQYLKEKEVFVDER